VTTSTLVRFAEFPNWNKFLVEFVSNTTARDLLTIQPLVQYYSGNTNLMRLMVLLSAGELLPILRSRES
jgi:hypothetical protein